MIVEKMMCRHLLNFSKDSGILGPNAAHLVGKLSPFRQFVLILNQKIIEEVNLIKGIATASMANGGIHQLCMKGTRKSILEEVERWRGDLHDTQLLWLAGVAGIGKSTLAKELAEKWKGAGHLAGRFFFSRDAEETRTNKLFFTTIAQQGLAHLGPRTRSAVALGIRQLFNPVSATLEEQCSSIFVDPLQVTQRPVVLVLDGIDECDHEKCQQLLQILIPQLPNLPHLKLLVTSRPELHIHKEMENCNSRELLLHSDDESNAQDVAFYIRRRLQNISLAENQGRKLIERAGGLFIWAKTVCDLLENLRGDMDEFLQRVLSQKLQKIDLIYRIALEQAIGRNDEEENIKAYMNVLRVIVTSYEPLSPNTINTLLNISNSMVIVNDLRSVLECRGSDEIVRCLHPTFREFLLSASACGHYHIEENDAHGLLGSQCLTVIDKELKYDTCRLFDATPKALNLDELRKHCIQNSSRALRYSCKFWGRHIILQVTGDTSKQEATARVEEFFKKNLIDWLYMISIQGSIDNGFHMLRGFSSADLVRFFHTGLQKY
jgi:hypothetical protein